MKNSVENKNLSLKEIDLIIGNHQQLLECFTHSISKRLKSLPTGHLSDENCVMSQWLFSVKNLIKESDYIVLYENHLAFHNKAEDFVKNLENGNFKKKSRPIFELFLASEIIISKLNEIRNSIKK